MGRRDERDRTEEPEDLMTRVARALAGEAEGTEARASAGSVADCSRTPLVLAAAAGDLPPESEAAATRHAAACEVCLGAYVAARAALARPAFPAGAAAVPLAGRAPAGRAVARALEAWDRAFGPPWLRYDAAEPLAADLARAAPDLTLPPPAHWPVLPDGRPDWVGVLLGVRGPAALEADSEAGAGATALVVLAQGGRVCRISRFTMPLTHRRRDERGLVLSGRLPVDPAALDRALDMRCAWIGPEGRLWTAYEVSLDPTRRFFAARFPPDACDEGELRILILEPGPGAGR